MRCLSLDASTSTVGIAVLEYTPGVFDPKLIFNTYYKPDKKHLSQIEYLDATRSYVSLIYAQHQCDEMVVEEYIKFMKNKSGAATVIPLAILNTVVRLAIYQKYEVMPIVYNVLKIRHAIKHTKELPDKSEIPEVVAKHLNIDFPYEYKIHRKTKQQEIREESYDMADAIAVGLAHIKIQSSPKKPATKTKKKNKSKKKP